MNRCIGPVLSIATLALVSATGCSVQEPLKTKAPLVNARSIKASSEQDGEIISLSSIDLPNLSSGLIAYNMMYWSDRTKTEALVAVPQSVGSYPLYVACHGGWAASQTLTHDSPFDSGSTDNFTQDKQWLVQEANSGFITILPMYRGYAESDGTVHGIDGNTLDTNNAIKAIMSKYSVMTDHIYLYGVSMGGAVVLKLASERADIRSVIANSPFVGWDLVGDWAEKHPADPMAQNFIQRMTSHYGSFQPNSPKYQDVSVRYQNINAPVLLLQGKDDSEVPWQTVENLYSDMKADHKTVQLDIFPGGIHGLSNEPQASTDITDWYQHYGE